MLQSYVPLSLAAFTAIVYIGSYSARRRTAYDAEINHLCHFRRNIKWTRNMPNLSFKGNNYKLHNQSFHYDLESIFSLHVLLIPGIACLVQLLMLSLLMQEKSPCIIRHP